MSRHYSKPWLSLDDQIEHLITKKLTFADKADASMHLTRIGYYRLSGYLHAFRDHNGAENNFRETAKFEDAVKLYLFDKELRILLLDALEQIEIAIRAEICHLLGEISPFSHTFPDNFKKKWVKKGGHTEWIKRNEELISRSKEQFVKHIRSTYDPPFPIWIVGELWDFGTMSVLFSGMTPEHQNQIAQNYNIDKGAVFSSWLRSLNHVRNICAHHCRLWNRNIVDSPSFTTAGSLEWMDRFRHPEIYDHCKARAFIVICIVRHLLAVIAPNAEWPKQLSAHLSQNFPSVERLGVNLYGMGVPQDWATWDIWK